MYQIEYKINVSKMFLLLVVTITEVVSEKVAFIDHPALSINNDGYLRITSCRFTASTNMSQFAYWTVNGTTRLSGNFYIDENNGTYRLSGFYINNPTLNGEYQCRLYNPNIMNTTISSKKVFFEAPRLLSGPALNTNSSKYPGGLLHIHGCSYKFPIEITTTFWVKQNSTQVTLSKINDHEKYSDHFMMPSLIIPSTTLRDEGTYRCIIFIPLFMKQPLGSSALKITFQDFNITFRSDPKIKALPIGAINISGCRYTAERNMNGYAYMLLNTKEKLKFNSSDGGEKAPNTFGLPSYMVTDDKKTGCYQCAIFSEEIMRKPVISKTSALAKPTTPIFLTDPILPSQTSLKSFKELLIIGCIYKSAAKIEPEHAYWMKDNKKLVLSMEQTNSSLQQGDYYSFPSLKIPEAAYSDQGIYQCVIYHQKLMKQPIISRELIVRLHDVSETIVLITLDLQWKAEYESESSSTHKELRKQVTSQLAKSLAEIDNPSGSSIVTFENFRQGSVIAAIRVANINASDERKRYYLNTYKQLEKLNSFGSLPLVNIKVVNQDFCLSSIIGDDDIKGRYIYDDELVSTKIVKECAYGYVGQRRHLERTCLFDKTIGPYWSSLNLDSCMSKSKSTMDLILVNNTNICSDLSTQNCEDPVTFSERMNDIVTKQKVVKSTGQVSITADILFTVTNSLKSVKSSQNVTKISQNILNTTNTLLELPESVLTTSQEQKNSSSKILKSLEIVGNKLSSSLTSNVQTKSFSFQNVALVASKIKKGNIIITSGRSVSGLLEADVTTKADQKEDDGSMLALMVIPEEIFTGRNISTVFSYSFSSTSLFHKHPEIKNPDSKDASIDVEVIQSTVLSASFGTEISNLRSPVNITFKMMKSYIDFGERYCHYWDDAQGVWLNDGVTTISIDKEKNTGFCHSNHLTNFALLLDVSQTASNPLTLQIVTWVGCGISIAGLFFTLLSYALLKKTRTKLAPKLLMFLCVSLMAILVIFLAGAELTSPRLGCQVVSGLLHYFILSTFCWMLVESLNMYRLFVRVFNTTVSEGKFLIRACIFSWGFPALVVAVSAGIASDKYGDDKICVVRGLPFFIAILAPVGLVLLTNFIVLILVMKAILGGSNINKGSKSQSRQNVAKVRITFSCSVVLGLTWVFAILAVGDLKGVFQWLFCISNSLQGFFIFVFYTWRNNDIKKEWLRRLKREGKNKKFPSERTKETVLSCN